MLNERVSPQTLGVARVLIFGLWIVNVWSVHLEDYIELPREILGRYGLLRLIPDVLWQAMWTPAFLLGFKAVLLGCLVWLVLGLGRYTAVAVVTCVLLILFDGMAKSPGHLNHAKFVILFGAWILAMFPANDAVALRPRRGPPAAPVLYAAPMVAVAVLLLLCYGFVGGYRIGGAGFDVFASDALKRWFLHRSLEANATGFELGRWIVEHPPLMLFAKLGFAVVGTMELLSPLCLFSTRFRWLWIAIMAPFHVASLFTLNIFFWENILIILFFLTDCDRVFAPRARTRDAPVLLFDGSCVMCNRAVQRLVRLDPGGIFRFSPLDGETAGRISADSTVRSVESVVLVDEDGEHVRSEAVLRTFARLGGLWRVASWGLRLVPPALRGACYDLIARHRTRWFGRVDNCGLLTEEERRRLLP